MVQYFDVDGEPLAFTEIGSGPVIICSHALFCDSSMFASMASHLSEKYRIVMVDSRAHGQSFTPQRDFTLRNVALDLLAVLDRLAIEDAFFLGLSMGGMAAIQAALLAPERIRGLVLIDTEADVPPWKNWVERWLLAKAVPWFGLRSFAIDMILERMFGSTFRCDNPDEMNRWKDELARIEPLRLLRSINAVNDRPSLLADLDKIKIGTLLIYGDEDQYTPLASGQRIAARLHNAKVKVLRKTGHLSAVERPEEVATLVDEFCSTLVEQNAT